ncbi:MAG: NAD(P)H-dependent oxidoreductase [Desulfobacterales bacterium]
MSRLLYIQASPRAGQSLSLALAGSFLATYRGLHPADTVTVLNVFQVDLPPFDGAVLAAKYAVLNGQPHTAAQAEAWKAVERVAAEFAAHDKFVIAAAMWNFSIPYRLKHYLDLLIQPGLTFRFSPESGYSGLVTGKPAFLALARGGEYPPGTPAEAFDFQSPYLKTVLGFIGFTRIETVVVEPTLGDPALTARRLEEAKARAAEIARSF